MERLKPLNDFIFKKTFGEEETKDNLIALFNAILSKKDIDKLVTLEIVENKELTPELIGDKTGIIDRKLRNKNLKGDKLQRWLSFFREDISTKELRELMDMDVDIRKAEEKIEYLSSDPKTLELYKARERSLHERANMISSAKNEGAPEKAIKVAEKIIIKGLSIDDIFELTDLPTQKVIELKEKMVQ